MSLVRRVWHHLIATEKQTFSFPSKPEHVVKYEQWAIKVYTQVVLLNCESGWKLTMASLRAFWGIALKNGIFSLVSNKREQMEKFIKSFNSEKRIFFFFLKICSNIMVQSLHVVSIGYRCLEIKSFIRSFDFRRLLIRSMKFSRENTLIYIKIVIARKTFGDSDGRWCSHGDCKPKQCIRTLYTVQEWRLLCRMRRVRNEN